MKKLILLISLLLSTNALAIVNEDCMFVDALDQHVTEIKVSCHDKRAEFDVTIDGVTTTINYDLLNPDVVINEPSYPFDDSFIYWLPTPHFGDIYAIGDVLPMERCNINDFNQSVVSYTDSHLYIGPVVFVITPPHPDIDGNTYVKFSYRVPGEPKIHFIRYVVAWVMPNTVQAFCFHKLGTDEYESFISFEHNQFYKVHFLIDAETTSPYLVPSELIEHQIKKGKYVGELRMAPYNPYPPEPTCEETNTCEL